MKRPLPYAGFDPDEDNFHGMELAPLHEQDVMRRQPRTNIDLARAEHLKSLGWSWDDVGRQLAIEDGRRIAYQGQSVRFAFLYALPSSAVAKRALYRDKKDEGR